MIGPCEPAAVLSVTQLRTILCSCQWIFFCATVTISVVHVVLCQLLFALFLPSKSFM